MKKPKKEELILVVDDNSQNLQVMASILSREGYKVAMANSGERALKTIEQKKTDLVLLDIMMPVLDGFSVCKKIKEDNKNKDLPVIFLTAKTETDDLIKGFELGAVDYIKKPFNQKEVLVRIKTHLDLKKSKEIIIEQNEENIRLNAMKDKFFSIMAHDLRNPFGSFKSVLDLLEEQYDDMENEERKEFINELKKSAKNLFMLLENLLTWSRSQRDAITYEYRQNNIFKMVESLLELFEMNAERKGIEIINEIPEDFSLYCDHNTIMTAIRNLLSNSIKFTESGGKIAVYQNSINEDYAEITVADTGIGMSEDDISKLFRIDVSHTTIGTSQEKGTGLGLILVKEFIEKNNGTIRVESKPGDGSKFIIKLPTKPLGTE